MNLEQAVIPVLGILLLVWLVAVVVLYLMVYFGSNILDRDTKWGPGLQVMAFIPITKKTKNKKLKRIIRVHYLLLKALYITIILIVLTAIGITIFKL